MKKQFPVTALLLLFMFLCSCTVRDNTVSVSTETEISSQSPSVQNNKWKNDVSPKQSFEPIASDTDLMFPEPMSVQASLSLSTIREQLKTGQDYCGLAFLGYVSQNQSIEEAFVNIINADASIVNQYPFLGELTSQNCVNSTLFSELFCLVPKIDIVQVRVVQCEIDALGKQLDKDTIDLLVYKGSDPILFSGSSSQKGSSNIHIYMIDSQGYEYSFCPFILESSHQISPIDGVLDFSTYVVEP